jgi:5-methylcytosine-specific restriction endonuclease McrA
VKRLIRENQNPFLLNATTVTKVTIYDNCRIYYQDKLLSFCDAKRARWYLKKNLARQLSDNPLRIELLFEPKQVVENREEFFLQEKENKCVVCGVTDDLTLHHVVPYAYRRLMPEYIKNHNCHDVVALCVGCHRSYEIIADIRKNELITRFGLDKKDIKDKHIRLRKVKNICRRLLEGQQCHNNVNLLLDFLGKPTIDKADLQSIIDIEVVEMDFHSLSNLIVPLIEDMDAFIKEWRQHFVDTMNPQYLPKFWSV